MGTLMGALEGVGSLRRWSDGLPMGWGALFGVVLLAGGSGGLQRWAHQPPYTEANPGEEVLMPCIVQNIQVIIYQPILSTIHSQSSSYH